MDNRQDQYGMSKLNNLLTQVKKELIRCLLSKEFIITKIHVHTLELEIQELPFKIWIANGADYCTFYESGLFNDSELDDKEKNKLWDILKPEISTFKLNVLIKSKESELKVLKAQIERGGINE